MQYDIPSICLLVPEITNCQECRRLDTKEQRDSMEEELARETARTSLISLNLSVLQLTTVFIAAVQMQPGSSTLDIYSLS